MYSLVEIGILNAITAGALALVVLAISRWLRRPAVIHALWVLVLLKFVTPPLVEIPVGLRLERLASITNMNHVATETVTESRPAALAISPIVINASGVQLDQASIGGTSQTAAPPTIETPHVASASTARGSRCNGPRPSAVSA